MFFFCGCLKLHRLIDLNQCWLMVLSLQTVSGIVRYLGFAVFRVPVLCGLLTAHRCQCYGLGFIGFRGNFEAADGGTHDLHSIARPAARFTPLKSRAHDETHEILSVLSSPVSGK